MNEMKRILSAVRRAVDDYGMIEDGDRIAVGVSAGKDSLTLLCAMAGLRRFYPVPFELCAMQGLVLNGVPHFHMVCSAPGNESFCGHVEPGCEVQYLMEIALMEVKDMALTRRKDEFNIDYIDKL